MTPFGVDPAFLGYVCAYAIAALGCAIALRRALRVEDAATRRGLVGLLAASGGWALFELAFLVGPSPSLRYAAYLLSLVIGLAAVGAWLYFCSAYTGRSFHANPTYRRAAVALYLAIVAVKLTNPIHGAYFETGVATEPFVHTAIRHGTVHWIVTGLSYALVAVGFFMLYEVFLEADYDARPLAALVAITGLPVALDVVGFASALLIDVNYEPLGVVAFAIGALYVYDEEFLAVQIGDGVDGAMLYLDDRDRIRTANDRAKAIVPGLAGARGETLSAAAPDVADALDADREVLEVERDGETGYYLVSDTSFSLGQTDVGRLVVLTDVTRTERQRRELERQNDQLEGFAAAIRHELLNTLQIVNGRVTIAGEALDRGDVAAARDSLRTASETGDRMAAIVDDLADLARYSQTIEDTSTVRFDAAVESAWEGVETGGLALSVEGDGAVEADPARLADLFESAFAFARRNGASAVTAALREDGFAIADDGRPLNGADPESVFAYGEAVPDAEAGMALPNVRMIARTHGWDVDVDREYEDGVRVVVSGASVRAAEA